jgi:hypothetical protein
MKWFSPNKRMPKESDADDAGRILFRWRDKENPSDVGMDIIQWQNLTDEMESLKEDDRIESPYWAPLNTAPPKPNYE